MLVTPLFIIITHLQLFIINIIFYHTTCHSCAGGEKANWGRGWFCSLCFGKYLHCQANFLILFFTFLPLFIYMFHTSYWVDDILVKFKKSLSIFHYWINYSSVLNFRVHVSVCLSLLVPNSSWRLFIEPSPLSLSMACLSTSTTILISFHISCFQLFLSMAPLCVPSGPFPFWCPCKCSS